MTYQQTLDYLFAQLPMFHRVGAAAYRADLTNTLAMLEILGHPEKKFKSIHIAGTNGKGSTSHLIASVLQTAGFKTGLYTSPHLVDFKERIRINGKKIPKKWVSKFVSDNRDKFEDIKPSFFEYTAAMAFDYFAAEKVDIAVIETGMGGRLDSTNVITPVLSIITNISKDHTAFLGNTLPEIAREKAGIIKHGVPVIIGETQDDVKGVFIEKAGEMESRIYFADRNYSLVHHRDSISIHPDGVPIRCPLSGIYQNKNFITAYQGIELIHDLGFPVTRENVMKGYRNVIRNTGLQGRWQIINEKPRAICDVGHNEAGIQYILLQLNQEKYRVLHWVFGLVNDKDADTILAMMPKDARYYFCKADIPRGLGVDELMTKAKKYDLIGNGYPTVKSAFQTAIKSASSDDIVFIGGSTFIVAEVLKG